MIKIARLLNNSDWRPTQATLIAGVIAVAGLLLTSASWWFLLLTAAGTLGPGILREAGWLRDKDEFQLQANRRAGYHAYVASTLLAFVLVATFRSSGRTIAFPQELATLFLATLWFTWFLSALIGFWGSRKAAFRILLTFGCAWLVFAILSNVGREWTGWTALFLHPLLAAPFFLLAWLSQRWPRVTGMLLLACSAGFAQFFGMFRADHLAFVNRAITLLLFIGPLLASGLALLSSTRETQDAAADGSATSEGESDDD